MEIPRQNLRSELMSHHATQNGIVQRLQELSIPLIAGVIAALITANVAPEFYAHAVDQPIYDWFSGTEFDHKTYEMGGAGDPQDHHDEHHVDGRELATHVAHRAATSEPTSADFSPGNTQEKHSAGGRATPAALTHAATSSSMEHAAESHGEGQHAVPHGDAHGTGGSHFDWDHIFTMRFLVNDLLMVLFFGIAAKEITEACLPGGSLNPMRKAINPLFATLGGVLGPAFVFLGLNAFMGEAAWARGWGIPTATDIALAWLVARFLFGKNHPAVNYLLLLAVADDAIGLGIIAIAYPDPLHPTVWSNALWILPAMGLAFGMRWMKVSSWVPYIVIPGALSWWGLFSAHLHPALALVFVVPFLPGPNVDLGLYVNPKQPRTNPLEQFEHQLKLFVDFGLFFFAFANAGVALAQVTPLTWIVLAALIVGKTIGILGFARLATACGFPLPNQVSFRHITVVGIIAGVGLTVALFVAGQAFSDASLSAAAKMGAVLSVVAAIVATAVAWFLRVGRYENSQGLPLDSILSSGQHQHHAGA